MTQLKRLHISPLTPELLPLVIPKAILPFASEISYHTIQSSPERNYGYVTLPTMEADKIQKKLNGSILKGSKMRIGEARPEKGKRKLEDTDAEERDAPTPKKVRKDKKKSKREDGVLPGVELPEERKVKRAWTEPDAPPKSKKSSQALKDKKEKKSKAKPSSLTDKPELLFKTSVPPNATPLLDEKKKSKKRKKGESKKDVVVHEFSNTTKQPAFLRDSNAVNGKPTSKFVDGEGWFDEAGNRVEQEHDSRRTRSRTEKETTSPAIEIAKPSKRSIVKVPTIGLSTSTNASPRLLNEDETSSSGSSLDSASDAEIGAPKHTSPQRLTKSTKPPDAAASSSSSATSSPRVNRLSITRASATPPPTATNPNPTPPPTTTTTPHPLETLFKRPRAAASVTTPLKKPNLEVTTSFSFFDPDVEEAPLTGVGLLAPQTPFTRRDLRERGQRSAAPTPDTAMPGKSFWPKDDGSDDDGDVSAPEGMEGYSLPLKGLEEEEETGVGRTKGEKGAGKEEGAFEKGFWANRGTNNRGTKRRVREVKKERRRAENSKRGGRG